jgi:hypothetical protein
MLSIWTEHEQSNEQYIEWRMGASIGFVQLRTDAKFIVPDWGDKVDSGMGLSYRPAMLQRLAGRSDNPMPQSTTLYTCGSPIQG